MHMHTCTCICTCTHAHIGDAASGGPLQPRRECDLDTNRPWRRCRAHGGGARDAAHTQWWRRRRWWWWRRRWWWWRRRRQRRRGAASVGSRTHASHAYAHVHICACAHVHMHTCTHAPRCCVRRLSSRTLYPVPCTQVLRPSALVAYGERSPVSSISLDTTLVSDGFTSRYLILPLCLGHLTSAEPRK